MFKQLKAKVLLLLFGSLLILSSHSQALAAPILDGWVNFGKTFTVAKLELKLISGNHQIGEMNTNLVEDLKVQAIENVGKKGIEGLPVTFTLTSAPGTPAAKNQALGAGSFGTQPTQVAATTITVKTDSNGFASSKLKLGDRAGTYHVKVDFPDNPTPQFFTATERELFAILPTNPNLNLAVDSTLNKLTDTAALTFSVQTNAVDYDLNLKLNAWPTNPSTQAALNQNLTWSTAGGSPQAFKAPQIPTNIYSCPAGACQGTKNFTFNLHTTVDSSAAIGDYLNQIEVEGVDLKF